MRWQTIKKLLGRCDHPIWIYSQWPEFSPKLDSDAFADYLIFNLGPAPKRTRPGIAVCESCGKKEEW